MEGFYIILRNEKRKQYDLIAVLLIFFNIAWFVYLLLFSTDKKVKFIGTAATITVLAAFAIDLFLTYLKKKYIYHNFRVISILVIAIAWLNLDLWWMCLLHFCVLLFYQSVIKTPVFFISSEYISYPGFIKRKINWSECSNVILKDGLLTIDLQNNKIIQQLVDETKTSVNEQEFNDFCRQQMKK